MTDYNAFLASKRLIAPTAGFQVSPGELAQQLFPFQRVSICRAVTKSSTRRRVLKLRQLPPDAPVGQVTKSSTRRRVLKLRQLPPDAPVGQELGL